MFREVVRALGRRWYVLGLGVLATAGLMSAAFVATPPEYNARTLVLLLPSEETVGAGGNPLLSLSGLEQPAGILVAYFAGAAVRDEVAAMSPTAQFRVAIEESTRGPIISVDVTDLRPESALSTLRFLTDQIPAELLRLQEQVSAPSTALITSMPLTTDTVAEEDASGTVRVLIALGVVGVVATGFAAFALDGMLLRRTTRRKRRSERIDVDDPADGTHAAVPVSARGGPDR